jgi:lipid-binding SYLF domain-containing protein
MTIKGFVHVGLAALVAPLLFGAEKTEGKASDVTERLKAAQVAFHEIMTVEDKNIPRDLLARAECAVIVPGLKKGAFIVGAKYGKGFITCRGKNDRGWSAPANIRIEGGSFGLQIGGGETDLFLLVMNESGADKLLSSEFKLGGEAAVMAGPVGRQTQAETDALMRAKMLGWSRSRGVFAGLSLEGSTIREDKEDNMALYGKSMTSRDIVRGGTTVPAAAKPLISDLTSYSAVEKGSGAGPKK